MPTKTLGLIFGGSLYCSWMGENTSTSDSPVFSVFDHWLAICFVEYVGHAIPSVWKDVKRIHLVRNTMRQGFDPKQRLVCFAETAGNIAIYTTFECRSSHVLLDNTGQLGHRQICIASPRFWFSPYTRCVGDKTKYHGYEIVWHFQVCWLMLSLPSSNLLHSYGTWPI